MLQMTPGYDSINSMYSVTRQIKAGIEGLYTTHTSMLVGVVKVRCLHHARDILRKAMCDVDMLCHADVCVMKPCNLVGAFLLPLPSLLDTYVSQEVPPSESLLSVRCTNSS